MPGWASRMRRPCRRVGIGCGAIWSPIVATVVNRIGRNILDGITSRHHRWGRQQVHITHTHTYTHTNLHLFTQHATIRLDIYRLRWAPLCNLSREKGEHSAPSIVVSFKYFLPISFFFFFLSCKAAARSQCIWNWISFKVVTRGPFRGCANNSLVFHFFFEKYKSTRFCGLKIKWILHSESPTLGLASVWGVKWPAHWGLSDDWCNDRPKERNLMTYITALYKKENYSFT